MAQTWHSLLFAHWQVPDDILRPLIPAPLELDTREGLAWIGVIPFTMTGIHLRGLPPVPWISAFHELNVRTYVTHGGKPGVWFLSLDAASLINVWAARLWFHLPYFHARMSLKTEGDAIRYESRRLCSRRCPAGFRAEYGPSGEAFRAARGSIDEWLTERYCLYSRGRNDRIYRSEIHHAPWSLQPAWAEIAACTMTIPHGFELPRTRPLLHFAKRQDTVVWGLERV